MKKDITYQEYKYALLLVNSYRKQIEKHVKEVKKETLNLPILDDLDSSVFITKSTCSPRLFNALKVYYINEFSDTYDNNPMEIELLKKVSRKTFSMYRNVGKCLLSELDFLAFSNNIILN